jgi:hypothetical protein
LDEEQANAEADPYGMTNKRTNKRGEQKGQTASGLWRDGRSFDCASCGEAARGFAQDDRFL